MCPKNVSANQGESWKREIKYSLRTHQKCFLRMFLLIKAKVSKANENILYDAIQNVSANQVRELVLKSRSYTALDQKKTYH